MSSSRQKSNYVMLCEAIRNNAKATARNLILNNVNVNDRKLKCNTPLHWAIIKFDDLDIIKMLLDKGADIHAKNHYCQKPLDVAIENNKTQAAVLLIEKGALIGINLNAMLLKAIEKNNHTIVKNLIDYGIQYNPSLDLSIAFNAAISRGEPKIIEHILPHYQFLQPSDKYIPREFVIKPESQYKECVELLLKWNFTVDPTSNQDKDFLYAAVEKGYLPIVLKLLNLGINVNLINSKTGLNLLKVACLNKHHDIVENLLKHHSSVNDTTSINAELLNDLLYNYFENNEYLLSVIYDKSDLWGLTCLHIAVLNNDPMMIKILLSYGAKIIDDPTFFNITCIAIRYNCEEITRIFIDHGVDVNDTDPWEKSLLHFCVYSNGHGQDSRYNIVQLLLQKGATSYIQTPENSLLYEVVRNRNIKTAQLLLDYNANVQYINLDGDTVLHEAIKRGFDVKFIKTLLRHNSLVNVANYYSLTPLLVACNTKSEYQSEIIKVLLQNNANINCKDPSSETPLHIACEAKNLELVTILLESRANPNATNSRCQTPLHIICKYKKKITASIIELLVENNANIEAVDEKGRSPFFVACRSCNDIAIKYLLKRKVNVNCMDKHGKSIIHAIVEKCNAELIKFLAHTQINFNSVDKKGNTPLHIAIKNKYVDVTKNLIKYGASINSLDKKNRTPLQNAIKYMSDCKNKLDNGYYYYIPDSYNSDINACKEIIKILKIHVIKLKTAGLEVNNQIVENQNDLKDYSDGELSDDEDIDHTINILQLTVDCEQEIEKMRIEKIDVYNMTLYDFLKRNVHFLSRYVMNKKVQHILNLEVYDEMFPLYIDIIRSRFRDAQLRYRLMDAAKEHFSSNLCPRLSDNCIDTMFSYLNVKEIKIFIKAMKPLNK